jgi:hypothetical protein
LCCWQLVAIPACSVAIDACCVAVVLAVSAPVFAVSAPVLAVSACVLNVCVSVFNCCNSDLYVVETCSPAIDDDKIVSANLTSTPFIEVDMVLPMFNSNSSLTFTLKLFISNLKSNNLVVESSDNTLSVFNPLPLKVVHNSLLALT